MKSLLFAESWYRAKNLMITIAETAERLFYTDDSGEDNLCGRIHGQLNASAYITCNTVMFGNLVQVQNDLVWVGSLHLGEVQVFGF